MGTLDEFNFTVAEEIDPTKTAQLAKRDWIAGGVNVLLVGPIGTGKTHLVIALGIEAARPRGSVSGSSAPPTSCAVSSRRATRRSWVATSDASSASTC